MTIDAHPSGHARRLRFLGVVLLVLAFFGYMLVADRGQVNAPPTGAVPSDASAPTPETAESPNVGRQPLTQVPFKTPIRVRTRTASGHPVGDAILTVVLQRTHDSATQPGETISLPGFWRSDETGISTATVEVPGDGWAALVHGRAEPFAEAMATVPLTGETEVHVDLLLSMPGSRLIRGSLVTPSGDPLPRRVLKQLFPEVEDSGPAPNLVAARAPCYQAADSKRALVNASDASFVIPVRSDFKGSVLLLFGARLLAEALVENLEVATSQPLRIVVDPAAVPSLGALRITLSRSDPLRMEAVHIRVLGEAYFSDNDSDTVAKAIVEAGSTTLGVEELKPGRYQLLATVGTRAIGVRTTDVSAGQTTNVAWDLDDVRSVRIPVSNAAAAQDGQAIRVTFTTREGCGLGSTFGTLRVTPGDASLWLEDAPSGWMALASDVGDGWYESHAGLVTERGEFALSPSRRIELRVGPLHFVAAEQQIVNLQIVNRHGGIVSHAQWSVSADAAGWANLSMPLADGPYLARVRYGWPPGVRESRFEVSSATSEIVLPAK